MLIQTEFQTWPSALVEISKYFIPAAITAVVSVLVTRYQWRMKETEMKSHVELKAREMLFNAYQKKLEKIRAEFTDLGISFGKLQGLLSTVDSDEQKRAILETLLKTLTRIEAFGNYASEALENDLKRAGMFEERKAQVAFMRKAFAPDIEGRNLDELEGLANDLMTALNLANAMWEELLDYKCESLFGSFVTESQVLARR